MRKNVFDSALSDHTPQSKPLPGKEHRMKSNPAGGYGFDEGAAGIVRRFVVLGIDNGTFYTSEHALARKTVDAIRSYANEDTDGFADLLTYARGVAMRQRDPLAAYAVGLDAVRSNPDKAAKLYEIFNDMIRTGGDMLVFMGYTRALGRGVGRGMRKAISRWYNRRNPQDTEFQIAKYRKRGGFAHEDVVRLAHPRPRSDYLSRVFRYITGHGPPTPLFENIEAAKKVSTMSALEEIIKRGKLTWEMIPTDPWHKRPEFWDFMIPRLPPLAFVRHLHRFTDRCISGDHYCLRAKAIDRISRLNRGDARVHPGRVFNAYLELVKRRKLDSAMATELEEAFFRGFTDMERAHSSVAVALDMSGSMRWENRTHMAGALGVLLAKKFIGAHTYYFDTRAVTPDEAGVSPRELAFGRAGSPLGGGTAVSRVIERIEADGVAADAIVIVTDEQSWYGRHPVAAFDDYKRRINRNAKLVVLSLAADGISLTDPERSDQMTVAGWTPDAADIVARFIEE